MLELIAGLVELGVIVLFLWGAWRLVEAVHADPRVGLGLHLLLPCIGILAGGGLTFVPYRPNEHVVVYGLPLPLAIIRSESGHWTDYPASPVGMVIIGLLNVVLLWA